MNRILPRHKTPQAVLEAARALLARRDAVIYFDISPLLDPQWTGIPVVAAGLAAALRAHLPDQLRFFLDMAVIDSHAVADALRRHSGLFLKRDIDAGRAVAGMLPVLHGNASGPAGAGPSIGLFPSVKRIRRVFDVECSLFHDLSTLVLPHFHMKLNVDHHMEAMMADLASDDLVVTVSTASRDDLLAYLGVDAARIAVVPNGVGWPAHFAVEAANRLATGAEPYVLILGTREPRKNVMLVFDMLKRAPELLASHRFVFAGKMGWLEEQHALPRVLQPARDAGRLMFPGFVGDHAKYQLLAGAEATLYPSLFEGFGLPVLESLSAGTPCVASWSSSVPEAGGALCSYFDPLSAADMRRALLETLARRRAEGDALREACRAHAARFSWTAAAAGILERLMPLIPENRTSMQPSVK
jgi:glycosyltransferase involved in cell wall biosynthesis